MSVYRRMLAKIADKDAVFEIRLFCYGGMLIHLLLLLLALGRNVYVALFETGSVILYLVMGKIAASKNFILVYGLIYLEMTLHSILIWFFTGSSCFTEEYILFLVMIISYIMYMEYSSLTKRVFSAIAFIACAASVFLIRCVLQPKLPPLYFEKMWDVSFTIMIVNFLALLVFMFFFCFFQIIRNREYARKMQRDNQQLKKEVENDYLTGLYNKKYAMERLNSSYAEYLNSGKVFSIAMGDIDFFKAVNDTYGHEAGDFVLKTVSAIFSNYVREKDIVSRWGGEEFLFIFDTDEETAVGVIERVRSYVEETPVFVRENKISVTVTFGVGQVMEGETLADFINRVDGCLYAGKKNGRNQTVAAREKDKE